MGVLKYAPLPLLALAASLAGCLLAAPAAAVVGGTPAVAEDHPWFTSIGSCGGSLVAPDRILTAGHCVAGRPLETLGSALFAGRFYRPVGFAMHPTWRRSNGENVLDDVALVILDRPVEGVAPVSLSGPSEPTMTILGLGHRFAPGSDPSEVENPDARLRQARLRLISDSECARRFRGRKGNSGERFEARRMFCATDVDGRAPLSSGCYGDSGGPFFAGSPAAPVVLGVVSWGGDLCGADRLPSVFAEVGRYRAFITAPAPRLAPTSLSHAIISGKPRVGRRLTCGVTGFTSRPTRIDYTWQRQNRHGLKTVGRAKAYRLRNADAGGPVYCSIVASNDGGSSAPVHGRKAIVHVPR